MWYNRTISHKIDLAATKFPVVVLTGARQSGKTELLKRSFPGHSYVSLDVPSVATLAEKEPVAFFERYPAPLLVDEIQYAPGLFRHLKAIVDRQRHQMGQFILTGSQEFTLMKEVSDSLAGRCAVLGLETLSIEEIGLHQARPGTAGELAEFIVRGGFPELWRDREVPLELFFGSYLATYLERDVRQILNVTSLRDFERFIRACAARSGQTLDKSALAGEVGVSSKAISSWLSVLEASNQIVLLEPWFANFGKRLVKSPKLYFCDSGLLCHLLGITAGDLLGSPFLRAVWEGYVFAELRKAINAGSKPVSLWFYRDKQRVEVDFLILGGGHGRLLECKWTELPDRSDTKNLAKVMSIVTEKKLPDFADLSAFVLSRTSENFLIADQVRAINIFGLGEQIDL